MVGTTALIALSACSTTADKASAKKTDDASASKMTDAQTAKKLADTLTQTKTTAKSEDGKMICKRTSVVGSNFKRKVCATADEWEARAAEDKQTVGDIQRRGAGPGTSN